MGKVSCSWKLQEMEFADFQLLSTQCAATVLHFLPFGSRVTFLPASRPPENYEWSAYRPLIEKIREDKRPVYSTDGHLLFLPLYSGDIKVVAIALLEVMDYSFAKDVAMEWLQDRCRIISRECALLKRLYRESFTGFLNGSFFRDSLELLIDECAPELENHGLGKHTVMPVTIVLVEVNRKGADYNATLNHINRAGHFIYSCCGETDVFCYLGKGVFGLIWKEVAERQAHLKTRNYLNWLKREGLAKVHIGVVRVGASSGTESLAAEMIWEQAWEALSQARNRGPYAFCFYESEQKANEHPLGKISRRIRSRMNTFWRGVDRFSLILMHCDQESEKLDLKEIQSCLGDGVQIIPVDDQDAYLYIAEGSSELALEKVSILRGRFSAKNGLTFSAGIASFPHHSFKKNDTPLNARKALLHTSFYGPATETVFNGLSLNVSGDIYYEEGDMLRAVGEYKKGITIEPGNINLLNSLGETYAQMNRHKQARYYFSEVLRIDPNHYMALFNSGVTAVVLGEDEPAIVFFEKALAVDSAGKSGVQKGPQRVHDKQDELGLLFQLGRLYCRKKKFFKAIPLLERSVKLVDAEPLKGSSCLIRRTLAMSYKETGKHRRAISLLQNVLNVNPYDSEALSMLGELYELDGQGDDIALSFCLKAVEIEDNRSDYFYRLARVYCKLGKLDEAVSAIRKSLKLQRKNEDALFLAGQIFKRLDRKREAAGKFRAVLRLNPDHRESRKELDHTEIKLN